MSVLMRSPLPIWVWPWLHACEMETEWVQSVSLEVTAVWCDVFKAANPLGWQLLSFILILFNIFYYFVELFGPKELWVSSSQPPPSNPNSAGDNEAHISRQQMEKEKQTPSNEIRLHAECLKKPSL